MLCVFVSWTLSSARCSEKPAFVGSWSTASVAGSLSEHSICSVHIPAEVGHPSELQRATRCWCIGAACQAGLVLQWQVKAGLQSAAICLQLLEELRCRVHVTA